MKNVELKLRMLVCMLFVTVCAANAQERPIALVGGLLLDGYEVDPIHHAVVVIEGNQIVAAGPRAQTPIPRNAHIIDTRGKTVMPGLIDMHVHTVVVGHGYYPDWWIFLEENDIPRSVAREISAKQMLRAGVTTAVDLGSGYEILDTREKIENGEIPGPRLLVSGPFITRVDFPSFPQEIRASLISNSREAKATTRRLIDAGVDVIKAWEGLTQEDYNVIVAEAHKNGIKVHAHVGEPEEIEMAINAGVDVLQHAGSGANPAYSDGLVSRVAHSGVGIVQTMTVSTEIYQANLDFPERLDTPELERDFPPNVYAELQRSFEEIHRSPYWRNSPRGLRLSDAASSRFIKAGAVMGIGTDSGTPTNFHTQAMWREIRAHVDAGMTPIQAISAATKTNAELLSGGAIFEGGRSLGTIEPGMLADIIVVDGDPLFDIDVVGRVELVIKDGTPWYSDEQATDVLRQIGRRF